MRISDWSSDVCSSGLPTSSSSLKSTRAVIVADLARSSFVAPVAGSATSPIEPDTSITSSTRAGLRWSSQSSSRSEEHTSELQSLMRISYAVFCLKKKKKKQTVNSHTDTVYKIIESTYDTNTHLLNHETQ